MKANALCAGNSLNVTLQPANCGTGIKVPDGG
jgi:hypothetical protein